MRTFGSSSARSALQRSMMTTSDERAVLAALFFSAGGLVALVAALDPDAAASEIIGVAAIAFSVAITAVLGRRWFTYAVNVVSSLLGSVLIALAIVAGRGGWASAVVASLYTFVAVHTALVLRWQHAVMVLLWGAASAVIAATIVAPDLPPQAPLAIFILVCGTLSGVSIWLVQEKQRQASTDPLTGLANRSTAAAALDHARATISRTGEPLSVVALDLDGFKQINDTQGHAAGDAVLIAVSRAWQDELRERDILARLGGDEFLAILPGADEAEARRVAQRFHAVMPAGVASSSGVASWAPGQPVEELVQAADRSLYAAKARCTPQA